MIYFFTSRVARTFRTNLTIRAGCNDGGATQIIATTLRPPASSGSSDPLSPD